MLNFIAKYLLLPIIGIIRLLLKLFIVVILLALIAPHIQNVHSYHYLNYVLNIENQFNFMIKTNVPTIISGWDISRALEIIAILIVLEVFRTIYDKLDFMLQRSSLSTEILKMRRVYKTDIQKQKIQELETKMEQVKLATGKNRQDLLKEFVSIKRELEKIGRDLAFLAIDVVDSTGMKIGEDPVVVEHDFHLYHDYVEAKFKENGYIKASWTPDGVMACFNTIEDAVKAAQSIIKGLEFFNKNEKSMKRDFQVRCGVNGGFVYYDDTVPLEQFSDRTIDIAGHMQKYAPPNSILIAKQMIEPVKSRDDFTSIERVVDGLEVCEWEKK